MCWKEKIQWQSVTNGLRKEHVLRPPIMQCVTVIIQLVSRDHVCRFENGSQMAEWWDLGRNRAVMECGTAFWGWDGYE